MMRKFLLAVLAFGANAAVAATPVSIVSAEFGIFAGDTGDELVFSPSAVVPLKTGQRYGWVIEVRGQQRSVAVREEALLPAASTPTTGPTTAPATTAASTPPAASDGNTITLPFDRYRLLSQRQLVPIAGRIFGEWTVKAEDEAGAHRLRVTVEEHAPVEFDYELLSTENAGAAAKGKDIASANEASPDASEQVASDKEATGTSGKSSRKTTKSKNHKRSGKHKHHD